MVMYRAMRRHARRRRSQTRGRGLFGKIAKKIAKSPAAKRAARQIGAQVQKRAMAEVNKRMGGRGVRLFNSREPSRQCGQKYWNYIRSYSGNGLRMGGAGLRRAGEGRRRRHARLMSAMM